MRLSDIERVVKVGGMFCDYQFRNNGTGCDKLTLSFDEKEGKYKVTCVNLNAYNEDDWVGLCQHLDEAILSMITGRILFDKSGKQILS